MRRTKKWLVGLLACLSVFAGSIGLAACGGISGSQGLEYTLLEDGTYAVTGIGSCENTKIVIPGKYNGKAVTSIGKCAFLCRLGLNLSLTSIEIPDSVTSIDESAFAACVGLTKITVDEDNTAYKAIDGNLYNKDGKTLIQYAVGKSDTSFMIPDSVTSIGNKAFYHCDSLTSITFNGTVEEWNAIEKGSSWKTSVPAEKVVCSDGEVSL